MPKQKQQSKIKLDQYVDLLRFAALNGNQFKRCISKQAKQIKNITKNKKQGKRCQICKNHNDNSTTVTCIGCDDLFHIKCVNQQKATSKYLCKPCQAELQTSFLKIQYVCKEQNGTLVVLESEQVNSICVTCHQQCSHQDSKQCYRCGYTKHTNCFGKREFCKPCELFIYEHLPYTIKAVEDYIALWKCQYTSQDDHPELVKSSKKNAFTLLYPVYSQDQDKQLMERYSLIKALMAKNMYFADQLTYFPDDSDVQMNNIVYEKGIQELDSGNLDVFIRFKKRSKDGYFPQLMIDYHPKSGYFVRATGLIAQWTLLGEYCGEVKQWQNIVFDKNDSIMTLLCNSNSKKSLHVVPQRYCNLVKFINGINNQIEEHQQLINVQCVRVAINNQSRIILYAAKDIEAGSTLYYDYNSGGAGEYPTEQFQAI